MSKINSESLVITFYCLLLMAAKQKIKFGVYDACRLNIKLRADAIKDYDEINKLATEKEASEEELKQSIEAMDASYFERFQTIDKSQVKDIEPENILYKKDNKEEFLPIFHILSVLTDKGIIK